MKSLECNEDKEINRHGGGPYVFKVQGHLCHKAGSFIPREGQAPVYAQLYIYNAQDALNFCMNYAANSALDCTTMQTLQDMLYHHHPGIGLYKQAIELTRDMGPEQQCKIALHFEPNADRCRYNLPTATSNKIAAILPGDSDQVTAA